MSRVGVEPGPSAHKSERVKVAARPLPVKLQSQVIWVGCVCDNIYWNIKTLAANWQLPAADLSGHRLHDVMSWRSLCTERCSWEGCSPQLPMIYDCAVMLCPRRLGRAQARVA